jgi:hypothetical protein|tara:strand:- start:4187 stop:5413 length:1227 start_codon:yes stop_codon:yes gene_type:complete
MQNILSRDAISRGRGFVFDNVGKPEICREINKIKNLLLETGARKGDIVTINIMVVNIRHVAAIFACAELGLPLIILNSPATKESLPFTKLALHGPSAWHIYDSENPTNLVYDGLHDEMIKQYGGIGIDVQDAYNPHDIMGDDVLPNDIFLISSTSGTTKASRPVKFSHKETMKIAKRNIEVFWFGHDAKVIHSRNLHHASALLTHLLPALMNAYTHSSFALGHDGTHAEDYNYLKGLKDLHDNPPSNIMMPNKKVLFDFLETFGGPFMRTVNINMCGFLLDAEFVDLAREYNVCFQSHYGSIDTAIPLLINRVDKDSFHIPNSLGVLCDDFYETTLEDGRMKVEHPLWDAPRYMDDELQEFDGQYILKSNRQVDIDMTGILDLSPFSHDTKIDYEQLRGHLHVTSSRV